MSVDFKKNIFFVAMLSVGVFFISVTFFLQHKNITDLNLTPKTVEASYQFIPTAGSIVTGSNPAILGATAASTEGVNMGSWKGALADDNLHFGITSTASGFNAYIDQAGIQLNNANTFIIQTEIDLDGTVPDTLVQICDWVSTTGVHNAADAQCSGGGWRNLNLNDTVINTTTPTAYSWNIYNGYWNNTATTSIDTPLSNFTGSSSTVRIRYYSTTNTTSLVHIDYLRLFAVINPIYSASSATVITGGTALGDYSLATYGGAGQTGSDNVYFRVPGTAGSISDFYMSHTGVRTYTGANTILYRAEYSCSAAGINMRAKIYNFNTSAWEDLTTNIACSTTDATNAWAKNNITISNYVSNGEVRIGWYGLSNNVLELRLDMSYIMIGTTNTDGTSEITYGTNSLGSVTNTRDLDMTGTANTWNILSADESNTQSFDSYANDSDNDVNVEEASAANFNFSVTPPVNSAVTGLYFAGRVMSGVSGTVQLGLKDYSGLTSTIGGWDAIGGTAGSVLTYTDNITVASVLSGGAAGFATNPEDHIDSINNKINLRLRTTAAGATANNSIAQWDFAMVSMQWVNISFIQSLTFSISDNTVGFGSLSSVSSVYATGDTLGTTSTSSMAHTISVSTTAPGGYIMTIDGNTLTGGVGIIKAIGNTATTAQTGIDQFGLSASVSSGTGSVSAPYSTISLFALATSSFPSTVATGIGDNITSLFNLRYLGNINALTNSGSYTSILTYTVTGVF